MDLKTAFPSSKLAPFIIEDAINRLRPLSIFLGKQDLTIFFVNALDHIAAHRRQKFSDHVARYIDETKSLFEILLKFRNENENFLLPYQLNTLYKIILLKPCLKDFTLNIDGTVSSNALMARTPLSKSLTPDEIACFTDSIDLMNERIRFDQDDLSVEARVLYYLSLLNAGQKFMNEFRAAPAISHEFQSTLISLFKQLKSIHDHLPLTSTEIELRRDARYFNKLPKADRDKVTFIADWHAKPPAL